MPRTYNPKREARRAEAKRVLAKMYEEAERELYHRLVRMQKNIRAQQAREAAGAGYRGLGDGSPR